MTREEKYHANEAGGPETALLRALSAAARGKRRSPDVARFVLDPAPRLDALARTLDARAYRPGLPRAFVVHTPKRRLISALPFEDRVVQHVLVDTQLPALERWFAPQSYACRVGKGTHRALRRAIELHRTMPWLLRLDVAKFFPSIDHAVMLRLVLPRTPPELHWLVERILAAPAHVEAAAFHFPGDTLFTPYERRRGLPIGNLTSQIWANAMLTPVDHLLASGLGLGAFVRYCDDLVVYAHRRDDLERAWDDVLRRCDDLRLRLHPTKCRLHRTTEPVSFVGFVLQRVGSGVRVKLRSENVRRFRARMAETRALFEAGAVDLDEVLARLAAWRAHAAHGHTRTLVRRELEALAWQRKNP